MKGLVTDGRGGIFLREDIPMPKMGEYDGLVKTVGCGICNGTDLKLADGHLKGFGTYPAVLGHEAVGRVIRTGTKVRNYREGDLVLRSELPDRGQYYSLWGGFSEYALVTDCDAMEEDGLTIQDVGARSKTVVPDGIDGTDACMLITLEEIYSALKRLDMRAGQNVVIAGCGPVGIAMANLCRILGAGKILLGGHHKARMQKALELGADVAVDTREEDLSLRIREEMGKADLFIDAVGNGTVLSHGLRSVKPGGVIGIYGIGLRSTQPVAWEDADYCWEIRSVQWPDYGHLVTIQKETADLVLEGKLHLSDYVTHRLPVEDYERGFELVKNREGLKVVLTFD